MVITTVRVKLKQISATDNGRRITEFTLGSFNNYVTLKLPFFEPPTSSPLHFITNDQKTPLTLRHACYRYLPPFIIYFSFLKLKKKKNKDTHPPMTYPSIF